MGSRRFRGFRVDRCTTPSAERVAACNHEGITFGTTPASDLPQQPTKSK